MRTEGEGERGSGHSDMKNQTSHHRATRHVKTTNHARDRAVTYVGHCCLRAQTAMGARDASGLYEMKINRWILKSEAILEIYILETGHQTLGRGGGGKMR